MNTAFGKIIDKYDIRIFTGFPLHVILDAQINKENAPRKLESS
jgi:hypothetical protein